jgi:hypothetical protein
MLSNDISQMHIDLQSLSLVQTAPLTHVVLPDLGAMVNYPNTGIGDRAVPSITATLPVQGRLGIGQGN